MFLVASKPSSWLSSSNIVLCTSLSPPEPPSRRDEPMESISSMKMMEGACSLAMTNSSRTMRAPAAKYGSNCELCNQMLLLKSHEDGGEFYWSFQQKLTLSNELLDQLWARNPDKGAVSVMGHSSGQQGLPSTWGAVQQHTLQTEIRFICTLMPRDKKWLELQ